MATHERGQQQTHTDMKHVRDNLNNKLFVAFMVDTQSRFAVTVHLCTGACTESNEIVSFCRGGGGVHRFGGIFSWFRCGWREAVRGTRVIVVDSTRKLWWREMATCGPATGEEGGGEQVRVHLDSGGGCRSAAVTPGAMAALGGSSGRRNPAPPKKAPANR